MFVPLNGQGQQFGVPGNVDPWTDRDSPQLEKLGGWLWVRHALVLLGGTERSGVSSNNTLCNGWEGGSALKLVALCSCMLASVTGNLNRFVCIYRSAVGLMPSSLHLVTILAQGNVQPAAVLVCFPTRPLPGYL